MENLELNKKISVVIPEGSIEESGIDQIKDCLYSALDNFRDQIFFQFEEILSRDIGLSWKSKLGTFPKRLSRYLYKNHQLKLSPEVMSKIGNIARENSIINEKYKIDFVDKFNWDDGDFGDDGSCFWSDHSETKDYMEESEDFAAIRFFDDNCEDGGCNGCGKARSWIYGNGGGFYIIFNAYGYGLLRQTRIMAYNLGLSYKKITLKNNGEDSGKLFINNGNGYIIGEQEKISEINSFDFRVDEICDTKKCDECGDTIYEGEENYTDHSILCNDCSGYCVKCNETYNNDYITYFSEDYYCDDCLNEISFECHSCDKRFESDEMYSSSLDYESYCESCYHEAFVTCEECESEYYIEDTKDGFCEQCNANKKQLELELEEK